MTYTPSWLTPHTQLQTLLQEYGPTEGLLRFRQQHAGYKPQLQEVKIFHMLLDTMPKNTAEDIQTLVKVSDFRTKKDTGPSVFLIRRLLATLARNPPQIDSILAWTNAAMDHLPLEVANTVFEEDSFLIELLKSCDGQEEPFPENLQMAIARAANIALEHYNHVSYISGPRPQFDRTEPQAMGIVHCCLIAGEHLHLDDYKIKILEMIIKDFKGSEYMDGAYAPYFDVYLRRERLNNISQQHETVRPRSTPRNL